MGIKLESTKPFVAYIRFEGIVLNLDLLVADEAETWTELERKRLAPGTQEIKGNTPRIDGQDSHTQLKGG